MLILKKRDWLGLDDASSSDSSFSFFEIFLTTEKNLKNCLLFIFNANKIREIGEKWGLAF